MIRIETDSIHDLVDVAERIADSARDRRAGDEVPGPAQQVAELYGRIEYLEKEASALRVSLRDANEVIVNAGRALILTVHRIGHADQVRPLASILRPLASILGVSLELEGPAYADEAEEPARRDDAQHPGGTKAPRRIAITGPDAGGDSESTDTPGRGAGGRTR